MVWSMMVQEQTWFGSEAWKSYGIQLLPLTPLAELRDDPAWVQEMLPKFSESCMNDPVCIEQGWSILVYTCMATIGQWQEAWKGMQSLDASVFESAGGNGHSMTNTLWYIATRPDVTPQMISDYALSINQQMMMMMDILFLTILFALSKRESGDNSSSLFAPILLQTSQYSIFDGVFSQPVLL